MFGKGEDQDMVFGGEPVECLVEVLSPVCPGLMFSVLTYTTSVNPESNAVQFFANEKEAWKRRKR